LVARVYAYSTPTSPNFEFVIDSCLSDPNVGITNITYNKEEFQRLPDWPKFTDLNERYLEFNELHEVGSGENLREMYCDFWNDPEEFTRLNPVASGSFNVSLAIGITLTVSTVVVIILYAFLRDSFRKSYNTV
jgi:hypothetical protein